METGGDSHTALEQRQLRFVVGKVASSANRIRRYPWRSAMRHVQPAVVVNCSRSSLLLGMMVCLVLSSLLVFLLI